MRRSAAWLVTAPLALAGIEAAHGLANAVFGAPEGPDELFASAASGRGLLPLLAGLAGAFILLGFTGETLRRSSRAPVVVPFALLPPVAFVLLEVAEGLFHRGVVPWGDVREPAFLAGLALQMPFAVVGYALSRLVLRLGAEVRELLRRTRRAWHVPRAVDGRGRAHDASLPTLKRGRPELGRAPPALAVSG